MFYSCVFVQRGVGGLPQCMLGYHTHPCEQTIPSSRHTSQRDTHLPEQTQCLRNRQPTQADPPSPETVTAADGTHATVMNSYLITGRNKVVAKVCVILFSGGISRQGEPLDQADTPLGPGRENPTTPLPHWEEDCSERSMSGWYASYWNAFFFFYVIPNRQKVHKHENWPQML